MTPRPRPRLLPAAPAVAALLATTGCFHAGAFPRSGDTLPAGGIGGGVRITVASFAPGSFGGESGNTAQRATPSPLAIMAFGMQLAQGYLTVGLTDRVELELAAGMNELALGTRVGLTSERRGDALSSAVSLTGTFRPSFWGTRAVFDPVGLGARATLDVSRDLGGGTLFAIGPTVSFEAEAHAISATRSTECAGFGGDGCGEYGPGAYAYAMRRELRVLVPFGFVFPIEENGAHVSSATVGLVPYVTPWSGELLDFQCLACDEATHRALVERFGVHLVAGFSAR